MEMTQRGMLTEADLRRIGEWMEAAEGAHEILAGYRKVMAESVERSSFREVSSVTGISTTTLQRWKREAGK